MPAKSPPRQPRPDTSSPATAPAGTPVNLALQGGGSHGAFAWGVLDRLLEDGRLSVEALSGTSAGAMNAVVLAHGLQQGGPAQARRQLDAFWRDVAGRPGCFGSVQPTALGNLYWSLVPGVYAAFDWVRLLGGALSPYQFNPLGLDPLRDVLNRHVDFDALRAGPQRIYLTATNVRTGKPHVFHTAELSADVVMASACLPNLFRAVRIGKDFYWDGGFVGNPSLYPFFYEGTTDDVLVVHINPLERPQLPVLPYEIDDRVNEITFNAALVAEMRAIAFVQKLLSKGWLKDEYRDRLRYIRVHSLLADDWLSDLSLASKTISDWSFLTMLRERGRDAASRWLRDDLPALERRTSADIRGRYLKN